MIIDSNLTKLSKLDNKKITKKKINELNQLLNKLVKFSKIFANNCDHKTIYNSDIDAALLTLGIIKIDKRHSGGSNTINYKGFCDNHPSQCLYQAMTNNNCNTNMTGGSNTISYKGFCDNHPTQCLYQANNNNNCSSSMTGGSNTINYKGFCDNHPSQCLYQAMTNNCNTNVGGSKTKNNKNNKKHLTKKNYNIPNKCFFKKSLFKEIIDEMNKKYKNIDSNFNQISLDYLNLVSKYIYHHFILNNNQLTI